MCDETKGSSCGKQLQQKRERTTLCYLCWSTKTPNDDGKEGEDEGHIPLPICQLLFMHDNIYTASCGIKAVYRRQDVRFLQLVLVE